MSTSLLPTKCVSGGWGGLSACKCVWSLCVRTTSTRVVNMPRTCVDFKCVRKVDVSRFRHHVLINSSTLTKSAYIHFPNTFGIDKSTGHVHQPSERGANTQRLRRLTGEEERLSFVVLHRINEIPGAITVESRCVCMSMPASMRSSSDINATTSSSSRASSVAMSLKFWGLIAT